MKMVTEELATLTVKGKKIQIYAFLKNRKEIFEIVYFNTMMLTGKKIKNDKTLNNPGVGQIAHLLKCLLCTYEEKFRSLAHV